MRPVLLVLFVLIAQTNAFSQTKTVDEWLDSYSVGLVDFEDNSLNKDAADSIKVTTKYFYGSLLRAFAQAMPELADLTKEMNLLIVANTDSMPRDFQVHLKAELIENLKNEGLSEWMSMNGAQGNMKLYAIEDEGVITSFVFLALGDSNQLTVVDFDGRVAPEVLINLMKTDPGAIDNLLGFGGLDFD